MKKLLFVLFIVICVTLAFTTLALAADKKDIKLAHVLQADMSNEVHTAAVIFRDYVNENSDTLEVKIYAAGILGDERAVYEGMQLGSGATCVISGTAILNSFNKRIGVLDFPFLWQDYGHVHKVLDGEVGDILAEELGKNGFKVLSWMDSWGYRNVVTSNKEVKNPEDLKGLKIRTIQSPIYVAALNAMGANATPMAFGEIYTAMQTGVLDGYEHGAAVTKAEKFYEVAKYIALTKHLFGPLVFAYSLQEWNKLSDTEKKVVLEGAKIARDQQRELAPAKEKEAFDFLISKGMVINEIDTTQFRENAAETQNELAEELGSTDLLEKIRDLAAE